MGEPRGWRGPHGHLQDGRDGVFSVDEVLLQGGAGDGQATAVQPVEQVEAGADHSGCRGDDGPHHRTGGQVEPFASAIDGDGRDEVSGGLPAEPGEQGRRRWWAECGQRGRVVDVQMAYAQSARADRGPLGQDRRRCGEPVLGGGHGGGLGRDVAAKGGYGFGEGLPKLRVGGVQNLGDLA
ncbi:hypothetical protein ACQPYA_13525 [Micromonospora sp. CA-263727]|uniref:hypothetical protein n=1 Tax=Micromonospora sp. CA-263727 TaxID=3239967 RepID=UPI003D8B9493